MVYAVIVAPATASGASDVPCHCFYTPEGNDSQRPARLGLLLGQAQKQADYAENGLANTRTAAMGATMHAPSGGGAVAGGGIDGDNTAGGVDVAAAASVAQAIFSDKASVTGSVMNVQQTSSAAGDQATLLQPQQTVHSGIFHLAPCAFYRQAKTVVWVKLSTILIVVVCEDYENTLLARNFAQLLTSIIVEQSKAAMIVSLTEYLTRKTDEVLMALHTHLPNGLLIIAASALFKSQRRDTEALLAVK